MNSSSTLVATVSINYEDLAEGFLTCSTCLHAYDQAEHTPKLLSCSHTICQTCLELIASSPSLANNAEPGCIKCPICRQNIAIPIGGIGALPPSFIVNQLFDLVNKKPREFIPKCSVHIEQELLFCETCDCVFCDTCSSSISSGGGSPNGQPQGNNSGDLEAGSSSPTTASIITSSTIPSVNVPPSRQAKKQHINEVCTVIPFSTAIKRMSEILSYRSQQCLVKLDEAKDNVQHEIEKLESNSSGAIQNIEAAFERIRNIIQNREQELLNQINKLSEYKKNVLLEQLKTIENEKSNLNIISSVNRINNETDVKNLSKKISDLTDKNDTASALYTPRENCLICFEEDTNKAMDSIQSCIGSYGKIRTSKTYPPYCTSELLSYSTNLRSAALVHSIDYDGLPQSSGGDPIQAELKLVGSNEEIDGNIDIIDRRDGTYEVTFCPPVAGEFQLFIYIFNRPIKDCPLTFKTDSHHNHIATFGVSSKKGVPDAFDSFSQPASLAINKHNGRIYVLDSFNNRIKILAQIDSDTCPFSFMYNIQPDYLSRCCTGIALLYPDEDHECDEYKIQALSLSPTKQSNPHILVTDWRNRVIYELNSDGRLIRQYSHEDLCEPTNIAVDSRGRIYVVDRECIFIFNSVGKLLQKLTGYKCASSKQSDTSSIKKMDPFAGEPQKLSKQQLSMQSNNNLMQPAIQANNGGSNKENRTPPDTATLNNYLINANNDKRASAKTNTLSSLIIKRKPKLSPSSSLQRGSKAVMSAASRIRSSFTLSHSTSLVSAASLQSMFNNTKLGTIHRQDHHSFDSQSMGLNGAAGDHQHQHSNNAKQQKSGKFEQQHVMAQHQSLNGPLINQSLTINEYQEDQMTDNEGRSEAHDSVKPFGTIRGIAIGPEDELIVADESRIRVLEPGDDYVLKRELLVQSRLQQPGSVSLCNNGRLCGMTYDGHHKLLLVLRSGANAAIASHIQIVDYYSGKAKFIIDSFKKKLIRPSSLATYGSHVIVSDLGNDCINKYRFY